MTVNDEEFNQLIGRVQAMEAALAHLSESIPKRKAWLTDRQWERVAWFFAWLVTFVMSILAYAEDTEAILQWWDAVLKTLP